MKWFKNLSIRKKLISYMLFFTVIPITLITSVALGITHRTVKDQLIYNHRVSSGWLQDRLNLELQDAMNQIYDFEVDKDVRNDILTWYNTEKELGYSERWTLISAMNSVISMDNAINSIDLYNLSKDEVLIAQRDGATMEETKDRLNFWMERDNSLQTNLVYIQNKDEILEVHRIHRFEDNAPIALLVIHLRPYEMQKILSDIKSVPEEKQELPMAAGAEEERVYLSSEMFRAERKKPSEEQRYVERITHSIPFPEVKKIAYFKNHIWGL